MTAVSKRKLVAVKLTRRAPAMHWKTEWVRRRGRSARSWPGRRLGFGRAATGSKASAPILAGGRSIGQGRAT